MDSEIARDGLAPGMTLGSYRIERLLGRGGMGAVYLAFDTTLYRQVALKVTTDSRGSETSRTRLLHEARNAAALNHPHICAIYEVGEAMGSAFIAMEYVEGRTLRDRLNHGALPLDEVVRYGTQAADALAYAHARGVVHRDFKAANVIVNEAGQLKVVDFGLARRRDEAIVGATTMASLAPAGSLAGTPYAMAPEQVRGEMTDARTDVWALGVLLHEMVSGATPFGARTTPELFSSILRDAPAPLEGPAAFDRIVRRCLAKEPGDRFQTMTELKSALEQGARESGAVKDVVSQSSIAVLPFADMSAGHDHEWFSDGMSDEIINVLAQIPGLKVIARTSAFAFKGKQEDIRTIGEALGVRNVLEGSVRKAGNRIRVTAQLINAADGSHLWSEQYDREMTDVFAIQDETARAIATALKVKLSPPSRSQRGTAHIAAYEAYLKARYLFFKATPESVAKAKESLDHAVALDPDFALAHGLLGIYYTMLSGMGIRPAHDAMPLARALEQKALSLDSTLPEAHAMLGVVTGQYDYDWKEANRQFRLAMAKPPVSPDIRFWYGNHYLLPTGRPLEAVEAMVSGLEADPLNLLYRHHLAVGLRHAHRLEEAKAELRKVLELDENFAPAIGTLAALCAEQGGFEEALGLAVKAYSLIPRSARITGQLAALVTRAGDTSWANDLIEKLGPGQAYEAPVGLAIFHAMCGEIDAAADWAARAIEQRCPAVVHVLGPLLSGSSRWPALAKMMNLPAERT